MSRIPRRALVEPLIAAILFATWFATIYHEWVTYVPMRAETFATNPYAVQITIGFALAIALVRKSPVASLSIVGGLLVLQLLFWPARFSQTSWDAYLGLILVAVGLGMYGGRIVRWVGLALSVAFGVAIAALLNFANLSFSGSYGEINDKTNSSIEVMQGFETWALIIAAMAVGAWFIGRRFRPRLPAPIEAAPRDPEAIATLSPREREILLLVARGLSNADIAAEAHIGESTVKTHLGSISAKLGTASRTQLLVFAYESGLLAPVRA